MPAKKNVESKENLESNKNIEKENIVDEEKELLKKQIEMLQKQLEQITASIQNKAEKKEVEEKNSDEYIDIPANKRIKVMNMIHAAGTYTDTDGKSSVRFEKFGDIRNIRYDILEDFRFGKYTDTFEKVELRILDKDVIKALNLEEFYKKNDISKKEMEEILALPAQEMMEKVKHMNKSLQISFASLFVNGIINNNPYCADTYKWDAISKHFNIKSLQEIVEKARD